MLRHACGYKLANDGHDTRSLAHYLGHRNLQSTARYTALAPDRFARFWQAVTFGKMVLAQGLGDEDRQAPRDEKGNRCTSATVGRDYAPHLD